MKKNMALAVVLVAVIGAIIYLEAIKPHGGPTITAQQAALEASSTTESATGTVSGAGTTGTNSAAINSGTLSGSHSGGETAAQFLASRGSIVRSESTKYQAAPEITDPTGFINAQPFTLANLIGKKVVLLDFWTYSCINCVRTIPYLNAWYAKYKDAGLVIVGIHTPEFQFEHSYANVAAAVKNLGIQYPVVLDNNQGTWNAYQNLYWPHEYLINVDGFITHDNVGEGNYNETERAIQAALADRDVALGIPTSTIPTGYIAPSNNIAVNYSGIQSPETYFGAARNGYLANGPAMTNGTYTFTTPSSTASLQANALYLGGTWSFEDQYATNKNPAATITYRYNSKNVYMVAASAGPQPVAVQVILDGKSAGTIMIESNELYTIVQGSDYGTHTLELIVQNPGLEAYTFTFG